MYYSNDDHMSARPVQPVDPNYPAEPVQPDDPAGPVAPAGRVPVGQPVQSVQPVQPGRPVMVWRGYRAEQIIYLILGILETLLLIRLVLKLLAANPDAGFTSLIYGITYPFVALFQGVFATPQSNGSVLELSTILAMIVYALLAWGIVKAIAISRDRRTTYTGS